MQYCRNLANWWRLSSRMACLDMSQGLQPGCCIIPECNTSSDLSRSIVSPAFRIRFFSASLWRNCSSELRFFLLLLRWFLSPVISFDSSRLSSAERGFPRWASCWVPGLCVADASLKPSGANRPPAHDIFPYWRSLWPASPYGTAG